MAELRLYESDPDRLLVERAAGGDTYAMQQLLLQNEQQIFRIIFRITKIREDAEDQTQETFMRAYRNLRSFRGNSKFKSWLTQIAINQALMCLRKRRNDTVSFIRSSVEDNEDSYLLDVAEPGLNPEQEHARAELADHLEYEVSRLPKALRAAFILRCVHEYTTIEAGIKLGISSAAVKSRVLRARKRLRERIGKGEKVLIEAITLVQEE
jgi:RNA polymerase sigma-70 factor, ECF subfamily